MIYKYQLSDFWSKKINAMQEFANGATQVTVVLKNGTEISEILISDATYIVAARGYEELPFEISAIKDIKQNEVDKNPIRHGDWYFWDKWH